MKTLLTEEWKIDIPDIGASEKRLVTLYDRPGPQFRGRISPVEKKSLFERLEIRQGDFDVLAVSATSWTDDEDFGLLLHAMDVLEIGGNRRFLFFITGKGKNRESFEREFVNRKFQQIRLRTGWLETSDYPKLLGAADVGISLHASSSGVDLPMKVVDMLGAELPVLALKFPAIGELIGADKGVLFTSANDLANALTLIAENPHKRAELSRAAKKWRSLDFQTHWKETILGVKASRPETTSALNSEKPRKGWFRVAVRGQDVICLKDLPRPFRALREVDLDKLVLDILAELSK
ncbi:mannosyltransferase [Perkinsus sp. BL_2016]|nr:mannosyltransferase [Perkinsus sp. BL_2016]